MCEERVAAPLVDIYHNVDNRGLAGCGIGGLVYIQRAVVDSVVPWCMDRGVCGCTMGAVLYGTAIPGYLLCFMDNTTSCR